MAVVKQVSTVELTVPLQRSMRFATRQVSARDFTLVQIETNDGVIGNGVVYMHVANIIEEKLRPLLLEQDVLDTEKLWRNMYREMYRDRKGAAIRAIGACDIALWDAKGKTLNLPVYKLLGACRDRVPCYGSGGYYRKTGREAINEIQEEVTKYVKSGFRAIKMKVGGLPLNDDLERVRAAREAAGANIEVMLDANNAYDSNTAIRAGKAYEKFDVYWFEEPVWPEDLAGSARVSRALSTPIASGELEYTRYGFRDLIISNAASILQPDAEVVGGVSEWLKVASLAASFNIPVAPHWAQEIHTHLASAVENSIWIEWFAKDLDIRKEDELYTSSVKLEDGFAIPSNEPGFGVKLNEDAIKKFSKRKIE
ncbi:MAG: mandelate racemase/muconate lactonizing enzyme family protein [archaeon]|nr:mandelate racemase/muconate lactonizing enzyme family protein [archaeon]